MITAVTSPTSPPATHNMGSIKGFSAARKINKAINAAAVTVSDDDDDDPSSQDSDVLEVARPRGHASSSKSHGFSRFKGKTMSILMMGHKARTCCALFSPLARIFVPLYKFPL